MLPLNRCFYYICQTFDSVAVSNNVSINLVIFKFCQVISRNNGLNGNTGLEEQNLYVAFYKLPDIFTVFYNIPI